MKKFYLHKKLFSTLFLLLGIAFLSNDIFAQNCNPVENLKATINGNKVTLSWEAPTAKSRAIILLEDFDSGTLPDNWTLLDADGDGYNWEIVDPGVYDSNYSISSHSFYPGAGGLSPDNYLITPQVNVTTNGVLAYWVRTMSTSFPDEHYGVYASTTGNSIEDFGDPLFEETLVAKAAGEWYKRTIELPEGTKYVAFRHFNSTDIFRFSIDNIEISSDEAEQELSYNIYRDGVLLDNTLDLNYVDEVTPEGTYNYCVEVVCGQDLLSDQECVNVIFENDDNCDVVQNLDSNVDGSTVTLSWEAPVTSKPIKVLDNFTDKITIQKEKTRDVRDGYSKIVLKADDVWGDGCGYQFLLDEDHDTYGSFMVPDGYIYQGDGTDIPDDFYTAHFEYMIPATAEPFCNTTEIIVTGEGEVEIPAGIYDFVIVSPQFFGSHCYIFRAGDSDDVNGMEDDYEFESGYKYIFTMQKVLIGEDLYSDGAGLEIEEYNNIVELSYNVYRDGNLLGNTTSLNYKDTNLQDGTYNYCVEVVCEDNLLSDQVCISVEVNTTGIKDNSNINIYPNPSNNIVTIEGVNVDNIYIYNNIGKLVEVTNSNSINVSTYIPGVYMFNINSKDGNIYKTKVVVY